jgi:hypothetical protein
MFQTLTVDEWVETYKPIKNPNNDWGDDCSYSAFETYGDDLAQVQEHDYKNVWTEVDGNDGVYIVAGFARVNRIQYYICEVPFDESKQQEVLVSLEQDCESCENPAGEGDCPDCGGSGYISHYPDTREELVELLGDTRANDTI